MCHMLEVAVLTAAEGIVQQCHSSSFVIPEVFWVLLVRDLVGMSINTIHNRLHMYTYTHTHGLTPSTFLLVGTACMHAQLSKVQHGGCGFTHSV